VHAAIFTLANVGEWSGASHTCSDSPRASPACTSRSSATAGCLNTVLSRLSRRLARPVVLAREEYCERILVSHLFPRAVELIERIARRDRAGARNGFARLHLAPLAHHLGIKDFAANRLSSAAARATGRLAEPVMAGDEKAGWCAEYAAAHEYRSRDCWGYADSHYDTSFLAAFGHPVP